MNSALKEILSEDSFMSHNLFIHPKEFIFAKETNRCSRIQNFLIYNRWDSWEFVNRFHDNRRKKRFAHLCDISIFPTYESRWQVAEPLILFRIKITFHISFPPWFIHLHLNN